MSRPLPWVRLERDFASDPRLLEVSEAHPSAEVVAAFAIITAEAARADGVYASRASLERSLRAYARLRPLRAAGIVAGFIAAGILTESDETLRLTDWESLRPAERHLSREQRRAQIATPTVATTTHPDTTSVEDNTTQEQENTTQHDATTVVGSDGFEVVVLREQAPRVLSTKCSHGYDFTSRRSSTGSTFVSAGHRITPDEWCREVPR